jgi:hypothetical protein
LEESLKGTLGSL